MHASLNDFMGRLVVDMGGAAVMANVILGEELGLYRAMADGEPLTPDDLAHRAATRAFEGWTFRRSDGLPWHLAGIWNAWTDPKTGEVFESYRRVEPTGSFWALAARS